MWPNNVGIRAIEFVVPKLYVDQTELEKYDGVSAGKYTIGLGQKEMGFCSDLEDINSLCLTALDSLVRNNSLSYSDIGRVDVGTETIIDKSKSVKTVLMDLFKESENFSVEGLDTTNACYGGTAALFNAVAWIESSAWDGRLAVVIAADIAIYAEGNARPTGGAGAVAMLIGPDAPVVLDRGLRATFMLNVYDFYKPDLTSEYPVVDGKLSVQCYLQALDNCYQIYRSKTSDPASFSLKNFFDAFVFHTPYCKLVQKSVARLALNEFVLSSDEDKAKLYSPDLQHLRDVRLESTYFDRDVEKLFMQYSGDVFRSKTENSLLLASRVGNMYTASVFGGLVSYLSTTPTDQLIGQKIGVFSYGSGLASSMYSVTVNADGDSDSNQLLLKMKDHLSTVLGRLNSRKRVTPEQFTAVLEQRAKSLHLAPYIPKSSTDDLFPGTWYIEKIDEKHRRTYTRKS